MSLKSILYNTARAAVRFARRFPRVRSLLEEEVSPDVVLRPDLFAAHSWDKLDPVFTQCRRKLFADPAWRYGPKRVHEVAREAFEGFSRFGSIVGKVYCDLGCGGHHPFGTSAIMFLNGAASTLALDVDTASPARSAEALFDLLADCLADPDAWHWSGISREEFLARLSRFDLKSLKAGNPPEVALAGLPMRHCVSDIAKNPVADDSVDLLSSRHVLEHFRDFRPAVARLYRMMKPGGIAFHRVDLIDHRWYSDPTRYHKWSFLAEDENWPDKNCNRLRAGEMKAFFTEAGFEIASFEPKREKLPDGFRGQLKGRFAQMPDEELEISVFNCALRKPLK